MKKNVLKAGILTVAASSAVLTAVSGPMLHPLNAAALSGSYVTLNQFSGHPASHLMISGGNYSAGETISITIVENGATIASASTKADTNGEFTASVALPAKLAQGNAVITATGTTSGQSATNNYYVSPFTPVITTSAGASDPFAPLTISGTGYAPNETVSVNFAGSITSVKADADGSFAKTTITTPNVPAASYTLVATGDASGASAVAYQYINNFYASASPTAYYVLPATQLGFNGSGFAANETITVTDASNGAVLSTFRAGASGSFENAGSFVVPASFAGLNKTFVLKGAVSGASTTTSSTIGKYFPSVSPSVYYTMPGTTVGFNGSGFAPGEIVDITSGTTILASVTADSKGNLKNAGNLTVPLEAAGSNLTYTLVGQTSHGAGTVSIQIGDYSPQVAPSTYYAMPGSTVTFTGSGYAPNEVVTIFNGTKKLGSFSVGQDGSFTAAGAITVAYTQANSSLSLTLLGSISKTPQTLSFGVGQLQTQLSPSSYYVLPFESFNVVATGFAPNETLNLMNGTALLASAMTNALGSATFSNVSVPANSTSSANLIAIGMTSQATSSVGIGIGNYYASISASDYYVKPGSTITISGSGFLVGENVTISAGSSTVTVTADTMGNVTTPLVVPFGSTKASLTVSAIGTKSSATSATTITLAPYTPQISPSTYYATPGTAVVFTASGYVAGEVIMVSLNGQSVGTETATSKGGFTSASYALPFGTSAVYSFTSSVSGTTTELSIGLAQFYAGVQLDSYYGNGGSTVAVSGSGYAPNEVVNLSAAKASLATVKTDANGSFTTSVVLPYAVPGDLTISATGTLSGASAVTTYTVATVYNSVELKDYAVAAGSSVTFIGNGYFAAEPVVITSSRMSGSYTLTASKAGSFNDIGYVLPSDLAAGEMVLTITGTYSHTVHMITVYVTPPKQ